MSYDRRAGQDQRHCDIGTPGGDVQGGSGQTQTPTLDEATVLHIALKAIQLYAEAHPRPAQVTQLQAAQMLELSRATVNRMIKAGTIKLNKCGLIPIAEIDRVLSA